MKWRLVWGVPASRPKSAEIGSSPSRLHTGEAVTESEFEGEWNPLLSPHMTRSVGVTNIRLETEMICRPSRCFIPIHGEIINIVMCDGYYALHTQRSLQMQWRGEVCHPYTNSPRLPEPLNWSSESQADQRPGEADLISLQSEWHQQAFNISTTMSTLWAHQWRQVCLPSQVEPSTPAVPKQAQ